MSSKSYNRGSAQIREQIDREQTGRRYTKREEVLAGRVYDAAMAGQIKTIEEQEAKIKELETRLAEAEEQVKLKQADLNLVRYELDAAQKHIAHLIEWQEAYRAAMEGHKEKHHILSQVIRVGLTPGRYHELHELVTKNG